MSRGTKTKWTGGPPCAVPSSASGRGGRAKKRVTPTPAEPDWFGRASAFSSSAASSSARSRPPYLHFSSSLRTRRFPHSGNQDHWHSGLPCWFLPRLLPSLPQLEHPLRARTLWCVHPRRGPAERPRDPTACGASAVKRYLPKNILLWIHPSRSIGPLPTRYRATL